MKNQLLTACGLGLSIFSIGQTIYRPGSDKYIFKSNSQQAITIFQEPGNLPLVSNKKENYSNSIASTISRITLGQAGNAFGVAFGGKTFLWADPGLNSITFSHRSNPTSTGDGTNGWLRYDYSTNGGAAWLNDQGPSYTSNNNNAPKFANARYPQGILYNPTGNSIADSAFFTYFAPSLASINGSGTQGGWGGHVHGCVQVSGNLQNTQKEDLSSRYLIPDEFTLTKTGVLYNVDASYDASNANNTIYKDSIFISKGIWNTTKRDFDYTVTKLYAPVSKNNGKPDYEGQVRISFADDGQTGYINFIGHSNYTLEPDSVFHLIVYKTINGGTTWSAPIYISMDGVKPLLPGAAPATKFTTGFEEDAIVDKNGNLHIVVPVSPEVNQGFAISGQYKVYGIFDVYTTDGGITWKAELVANPEVLSGKFGTNGDANNPELTEYNRCQVSKNWNGDKLFFTWFDTDTAGFGNSNSYPNAFIKGLDITTGKWTDSITTSGTALISDDVTFGCASYYVFDNSGTYTIPIAYQHLNDQTKSGVTTQFYYVNGLTLKNTDFTKTKTSVPLYLVGTSGIAEIEQNRNLTISQNYPNPFNDKTSFTLTLIKSSNVTVALFNSLGQKVYAADSKFYAAGSHTLTINSPGISAGVYYCTIKTEDASVTQRMIVK